MRVTQLSCPQRVLLVSLQHSWLYVSPFALYFGNRCYVHRIMTGECETIIESFRVFGAFTRKNVRELRTMKCVWGRFILPSRGSSCVRWAEPQPAPIKAIIAHRSCRRWPIGDKWLIENKKAGNLVACFHQNNRSVADTCTTGTCLYVDVQEDSLVWKLKIIKGGM